MRTEKHFRVDDSLCSACGTCANDCLMGIIEMDPKPKIPTDKESQCMECQHCLAVCPKGAISILDKDPSDSEPRMKELPSLPLLKNMIKTRRSIRHYKQEAVDNALLHDLLETASYAPTGENGNSVCFTVVEDMETMKTLRELTYKAILTAGKENKVPQQLSFIYEFARLWERTGNDVIFRGAPHVVIASVPENCPSPKEDAMIALSYFEILAVTAGLGTLWDGMFKLTLEYIVPELRKTFGIPEGHLIGYSMIFGKPAVRYARSIQSDGIHIHTLKI